MINLWKHGEDKSFKETDGSVFLPNQELKMGKVPGKPTGQQGPSRQSRNKVCTQSIANLGAAQLWDAVELKWVQRGVRRFY